MYARVAQWEGADAKALKESAAEIRAQAEAAGGPPPGVPAKEFLLLHDTELRGTPVASGSAAELGSPGIAVAVGGRS